MCPVQAEQTAENKATHTHTQLYWQQQHIASTAVQPTHIAAGSLPSSVLCQVRTSTAERSPHWQCHMFFALGAACHDMSTSSLGQPHTLPATSRMPLAVVSALDTLAVTAAGCTAPPAACPLSSRGSQVRVLAATKARRSRDKLTNSGILPSTALFLSSTWLMKRT